MHPRIPEYHGRLEKIAKSTSFKKNTIDDVRIIGASTLQQVYTWVDAAYGVHSIDMKSHTGGIMSMGTGTLHQQSSKQKLNVKISTESEIVGTSGYIPYNVWLYNFSGEQGYKVRDNILFQDNQSAIKSENEWSKIMYQ